MKVDKDLVSSRNAVEEKLQDEGEPTTLSFQKRTNDKLEDNKITSQG